MFLTSLRVLLLSLTPLDLAADEAHYWEWSRRLDWAFYSKGPVVAYLIATGVWIFGHTAFGVRLAALLCSSLFLLIFYLFARGLTSATTAFGVVAVMALSLIFASQGLVMTTDPPLALAWVLSLYLAYRAFSSPVYWLPFGLTVGFAVLSKYTALILYPSIVLLLLLTPRLRGQLYSSFFWGGVALFIFSLTPVLIWNLSNDWVNLFHNASHFQPRKGFGLRPWYLGDLLGGQLGLVGPFVFPLMLYAFYLGVKRWRDADSSLYGLLVFSSLPLLFVCMTLSLFKRVYANWPMPVAIGGFLLLACLYEERPRPRLLKASLYTNGLFSLFTYAVFLGMTFGLPGKILPTKKLVGWKDLGVRLQRHIDTNDPSFIVAGGYAEASALAFYASSHPKTLCDNGGGRRMNQYDVWNDWPNMKGKDAVIVVKDQELNPRLFEEFQSVRQLEGVHEVHYSGSKLREFRFYLGTGYSGNSPMASARF